MTSPTPLIPPNILSGGAKLFNEFFNPSALATYQPNPDERLMQSWKNPLVGGDLKRGQIWQDPNISQPNGGWGSNFEVQPGPFGLRFLYNPTTITMGYSLTQDFYPPIAQMVPGAPVDNTSKTATAGRLVGPLSAAGNTQLTFGLWFNRMYDCWDDPNHRGVRVDVEQLEKMTGYSVVTPYLQLSLCYVSFGGNSSLRYYGYITGFSVTYTNFTQNMVPWQCSVDNITMLLMPEPQSPLVKTDPTGGGNAAQTPKNTKEDNPHPVSSGETPADQDGDLPNSWGPEPQPSDQTLPGGNGEIDWGQWAKEWKDWATSWYRSHQAGGGSSGDRRASKADNQAFVNSVRFADLKMLAHGIGPWNFGT